METVNNIIKSNLNVTVKHILQEEIGSMRKNFSAYDISQVTFSLFHFYRLVGVWSFRIFSILNISFL